MTPSVLVTGGNRASGIGAAIARAFVADGRQRRRHPSRQDRRHTPRQRCVPAGTLGVFCDVTDAGSVDAAFPAAKAAHGPVEVLVSSTGIAADTVPHRMSEERSTTVLGHQPHRRIWHRATAGRLRARGGRMNFVSSVAARLGGPGQANYAASKAGLIGLARSIAREPGSHGITANVVAPGFVETDMMSSLSDSQRQRLAGAVPLGRAATPAEVADAVTWLPGPDAGYVTGAVIPVADGLDMGR